MIWERKIAVRARHEQQTIRVGKPETLSRRESRRPTVGGEEMLQGAGEKAKPQNGEVRENHLHEQAR